MPSLNDKKSPLRYRHDAKGFCWRGVIGKRTCMHGDATHCYDCWCPLLSIDFLIENRRANIKLNLVGFFWSYSTDGRFYVTENVHLSKGSLDDISWLLRLESQRTGNSKLTFRLKLSVNLLPSDNEAFLPINHVCLNTGRVTLKTNLHE